jgi:hypothetical protein
MAEEENHIDQLFKKKLGDRVSAPPEDIWEGIESTMPKSLFFRFRYEYMNVYYASLIAGCFLFSGGALIYSIKNYYKTVQVHVEDVEDEDSLAAEQKVQDSITAIANQQAADSINHIAQPLHTSVEEKPKPRKPKKVVYITDYDTIVKYDTLRTKKKRK